MDNMLLAAHTERFEDLEEAWRQRVEDARERYLEAVSQTERAAEKEAHRIKGEAKALYLGELRTFSDLVLNGRIPPEGQ
jgi:F0F1-type ATP synthase membrane subunit b/b'